MRQLDLPLWHPRKATPEEQKHWIDGELKYWADKQGPLIIFLSILQVSLLGFMLGMMGVINWILS